MPPTSQPASSPTSHLVANIQGAIAVGFAVIVSGWFPRWVSWTYAIAAIAFVLSNFLLPVGRSPASLILFGATVVIARRAWSWA